MDLKIARAALVEEWKGIETTVGRVLFAVRCGFVVLGAYGLLLVVGRQSGGGDARSRCFAARFNRTVSRSPAVRFPGCGENGKRTTGGSSGRAS